ncbi:hypothetical protein FOYG_08161 [Fusarium oxysporum NRRL 32931]|uniref:Uncharacterized protein n=1 Tax=Fusarium oxysporum NRRL 32931 TaxID=660029 RepID=W9I7Y6_FUSOX|nr:hypothetical protein FOYG_08161 [Fusarium oxysporum NRRL 32931]
MRRRDLGLCFRHAVLSAVCRTVINGRLPSSARSPRVPIFVERLNHCSFGPDILRDTSDSRAFPSCDTRPSNMHLTGISMHKLTFTDYLGMRYRANSSGQETFNESLAPTCMSSQGYQVRE